MLSRIFIMSMVALSPLLYGEQEELAQLRQELHEKRGTPSKEAQLELLNVSYDPTREFYEAYNASFEKWWKEKSGQEAHIIQSHGGSGTQARAVIAGLEADVVSLALALDIDAIEKFRHIVGKDWQSRLPNNSSPYYSTIVFLVRKGNPKQIKDWDDLAKEGVLLVIPNPKTSGGARWAYMAALAWAEKNFQHDPAKMKEFMVKLYANAPLLDTGARASTTTFVQRKQGDVLLTWENEAYLTMEKIKDQEFEIVYPSISIKAEPPVTWIETFIKEKGTEDLAKFYLKYLYSRASQELIAQYYFRPYDLEVAKKYRDKYPEIALVSIDDFGGWKKVQEEHFKDGGLFDEIFQKGKE